MSNFNKPITPAESTSRSADAARYTPAGATITVTIIEDQLEIRDGLAQLIDAAPGFCCSGAYRSVEEAAPKISAGRPAVLLLDIGLPGMNGIDGIKLLKELHPSLLILMLTIYNDNKLIFDALCAGACGYLLKKTPPARLLSDIREAVQGGAPMSPEVARQVVGLFREFRPLDRASYQLTPHETRLLKLLIEGHTYRSAAGELGVSVHAVSFHLRSIYEKLHVHSKSEAVAKALRHRLIN